MHQMVEKYFMESKRYFFLAQMVETNLWRTSIYSSISSVTSSVIIYGKNTSNNGNLGVEALLSQPTHWNLSFLVDKLSTIKVEAL